MPRYYISWEATFISDNLVIRVVYNKIFCSRNGTIIESIAYGPTPANWAFGIMAIGDTYTEMASISLHVNDGLGMMKYQGHKVPEAGISKHANCAPGH